MPTHLTPAEAGELVFVGLPVPVCVLDAAGHLAAMNPAAERFWAVRFAHVAGQPAADVLGVRRLDGDGDPWPDILRDGGGRVPCRITGRDGITHVAAVAAARLQDGRHTVLGVVAEEEAPSWALTDAVSGLPNRLAWRQERERWLTRAGAAVLFDLDDLKETNDLYGHRTGDLALQAVGRALRAQLPAEGLALRWGGDEFLALLDGVGEAEARAWAERVAAWAAEEGRDLPVPPRLSRGAASFAPGEVDEAIAQADEALYTARGALLPAASGARIVLTREGQRLAAAPTDDAPAPDYAAGFTAGFDTCFRAAFRRAVEEAQRFVAFAAPTAGCAAIELGAGAGRIAIDGGLAEAIGPSGQLLATDPSAAQLGVLRRRLAEAGLGWVRTLRTRAEALPVASGCADLVIGSTFLHFTDHAAAIREAARVLRPGGLLVVDCPLPPEWPPFWRTVMAPIDEEAARRGLRVHPVVPPEAAIRAAVAAAGLRTVREASETETYESPDPVLAQAFVRQIGGIRLLLRGWPAELQERLEEEVLGRIPRLWDAHPPEDRAIPWRRLFLAAEKA